MLHQNNLMALRSALESKGVGFTDPDWGFMEFCSHQASETEGTDVNPGSQSRVSDQPNEAFK